MALNSKKYERMFSITGSDGDRITNDQKTLLEEAHADNSYLLDPAAFKSSGALLLQLDNITQELDHLRDKILANETCCTTQTGRTHITTAQARAITLNEAKTGITLSQARAITLNSDKRSLFGGKATVLSFSDMITTPPPKGSKTPTYSIVLTAVNKGVSKSVTLTLK